MAGLDLALDLHGFSKESLSISPRDDRIPSPVKENEEQLKSSPKKMKDEKSTQPQENGDTHENLNDSKKTSSSSPSPLRRVLEVPEGETKPEDNKEDPNNPFSNYEAKHGVKVESKEKRRSRSRGRRSRSRGERRSRSRDRSVSPKRKTQETAGKKSDFLQAFEQEYPSTFNGNSAID